jgi:hypothetical protein
MNNQPDSQDKRISQMNTILSKSKPDQPDSRGQAPIEELRSAIDKARRLTASDPNNQWCRQATIILDAAFTGNDQGELPPPPAEKKG